MDDNFPGPKTRAALEREGIRVAAEVEIDEYVAMAGGPCCATGVLAREPACDPVGV